MTVVLQEDDREVDLVIVIDVVVLEAEKDREEEGQGRDHMADRHVDHVQEIEGEFMCS